VTQCDHCGVAVHLPDAVWRSLHPGRTAVAWVVRFEGPSRPKQRAIAAANKAAAEARRKEEKQAARAAAEAGRADRARRDAEKAEARRLEVAAERAAAERALRLKTAPLVALAWLAAGSASALALVSMAWYTLGTPAWLQAVILPWARPWAPRIAVGGGVVALGLAWAVSFAASAVRSRQGVRALLSLGVVQLGASLLPVIGPIFAGILAFQHLAGAEPRLADMEKDGRKVPWSVRPPLALLYPVIAAHGYVAVAAALGWKVRDLLDWIME
jgi:hypothetical protein